MSVFYVDYLDRSGKKGATRFYIADDEDEIDFLDRARTYLVDLKNAGCHIFRVEVM